MDVPYLIHVPDGDELWLVDGEQRMLITPMIYDLLASNGADLPPAYGIEELREQNAKLRELVRDMWQFTGAACKKYPRLFDPSAQGGQMVNLNMIDAFEQRMRELGVEVDG